MFFNALRKEVLMLVEKYPPEELVDIALETIDPDAKNAQWRYKRLFHQACAPWMVPCKHKEDSYQYVPLEGHKLSDGRIYLLGKCTVCNKILWGETSKAF
jgi:hypothetical protein